jgi:outer membrane protein OmpA-like peptidoglycan-associated protein
MKNKIVFPVVFIFFFINIGELYSQIIKILPQTVNIPGFSVKSPFVSIDGKNMIYIIENKDSSIVAESYRNSDGTWSKPQPINAINKFGTQPVFFESPTYNQDVSEMFVSILFDSKDSSNDIYCSKKISGKWQKPVKLPKQINTSEYESDPCISPDGKTLFFVRNFDNPDVGDLQCTQIYFSHFRDSAWTVPKVLPSPVNSGCDGAPRMSADGKTLYFSSIREEGKGGGDLYFAKNITENVWFSPVPIDTLNSEKNELYASVNSLENTLFFETSEKNRRKSPKMLAYARLPGKFCPENVVILNGLISDRISGKSLSARVDLIDPNSSTPIYSCYSDSCNGKYSIILQQYKKYRIDVYSAGFSHVISDYSTENLKETVSEKKDFALFKEINLSLSVFDSEIFEPLKSEIQVSDEKTGKEIPVKRSEIGKGKYNLILPLGKKYRISASKKRFETGGFILDLSGVVQFNEFERDIELTQSKVEYKIGISDAETGTGVDVDLEITNLSTNEHIVKKVKTGADGKVTVSLRDGDKYDISVSPKGYAFFNTVIEPESEGGTNSTDVKLTPLKQETKIELNDITFEFNSADLNSSSYPELDRLIKLMQTNPDMKIEISAHTDDVGAQNYNLKLSGKRAQSVMNYLTDKGMPATNITAKGYGKSQPKYLPENTEENRAKNRRVEMKVISVM